MWRGIVFSVVCDAIIVWAILAGQERMTNKFEYIEEKSATTHQEMMKQAKEGTIWLLRDDIIKTIDYHEATKSISQKQFKRVKDEYDYYCSIGGNHDVKERFDDFYYKIFGTGTIKMVASDAKTMER